MKNTSLLLALFITALFFGCAEDKKEVEVNRFSGLWSLHIMEKQDSVTGEWNEWREGMQGNILYHDNGHMSLHITTKGYEKTDLRFTNFDDSIADEALRYLTNSYVYFAKYTVDNEKNVVEHARISHSNPGMWNQVVERRFTFRGDTLILQPVEKEISGLRLKWLKKAVINKK